MPLALLITEDTKKKGKRRIEEENGDIFMAGVCANNLVVYHACGQVRGLLFMMCMDIRPPCRWIKR